MAVNARLTTVVNGMGCGERRMRLDIVAREIVDAAMCVHTRLGPGMLESAYEACLEHEISKRLLIVRKQVPLPLHYDDLVVDIGYRIDLLVQDAVVIELKSVAQLLPIHTAQVLSYLRCGGYELGFLLNFNTVHMRDGVRRLVNQRSRRVFPERLAPISDATDIVESSADCPDLGV